MHLRTAFLLAIVVGHIAASCTSLDAAAKQRPGSDANRVVRSIKDVRRVFVRRIKGDRIFASSLRAEMRGMGLSFVRDKNRADAVFEAEGIYENGAFYGGMKFTNANGKPLWQARATRPRGSSYMAYSRLTDKLRAALRE
jgi:hypothetical protein